MLMETFDLRYVQIPFEIWGALFCVFAAIMVLGSKKDNIKAGRVLVELLAANALLLVTDVFVWLYRGSSSEVAGGILRVSNFILVFSMFCIITIFAQFLYYSIREAERPSIKIFINIIKYLACSGIILLIISQFNNFCYRYDSFNLYHENDGMLILYGLMILQLVIIVIMLVSNYDKIEDIYRRLILVYAFMGVISGIAQPLYRGISIVNFAITLASMISFAIYEIEQGSLLTTRGIELSRLRSDMLLSQIKPHFIYNALNTIKFLCYKDPEEAAATVDDLADYLRFSTDHMNSNELIPIEKVVENISHYVEIERHRFGERLTVEYAIEDKSIMLPPFVVQPLLENAIKHGILKKEEGGRVVVRAWSDALMSYVEVSDDGTGFDVETAFGRQKDGRKHLGIANVKSRIEELYGGNVTFESEEGSGTTVTITIPRDRMEEEEE